MTAKEINIYDSLRATFMYVRAQISDNSSTPIDQHILTDSPSYTEVFDFLLWKKQKIKRKNCFNLSIQLTCLLIVCSADVYAIGKAYLADVPSKQRIYTIEAVALMMLAGLITLTIILSRIGKTVLSDELSINEKNIIENYFVQQIGRELNENTNIRTILSELKDYNLAETMPLLSRDRYANYHSI